MPRENQYVRYMRHRSRRLALVRHQDGKIVEIIGLYRAARQFEDLDHHHRAGEPRAGLVTCYRRNYAAELIRQLLLGQSFPASPISKLHKASQFGTLSTCPYWIDIACPIWQYANMDKPQIGYIRLVSDNTQAPNRIRELRDAQGISQAELARRINVSAPALQKVEVGSRKLDQLWMRKIARALKCTSADLLPVEDNPWALSDNEKELIERLRSAEAEDREKFSRVADAVLDFKSAKQDVA